MSLNIPLYDHKLPIEQRIEYLLSELTIDEKISLLPTRQEAIPRLGIKEYNVCAEGAHGLLVRVKTEQWPCGKSTVFPQPIGLSCTWDKDLLHRIGDIIGNEARIWYERDNHGQWLTIWSPTIDMERDPRWGRNEEAYGEDPYLAGKLSSNFVRGVQGDHPYYLKATCALKHFYCNNMEKDRAFTSADIGERVKHEYYLKVFEYAVKEGKAHSIMAAYNEVNGMPCLINPENVSIVREKWGMDGYIVSDGDDLPQMVTAHKYCKTQAEAIALAIKAGCDNFPVQKNEFITKPAKEALKKGLIEEKDIDRAIASIFRTRIRLGMFDPAEVNPFCAIKQSSLCCKQYQKTALEAAQKSVVLLKNDGILPLSKKTCGKVLMIGDLAEKNMADWYSGNPVHAVSPLDAISKIIPKDTLNVNKNPIVDTVDMHDLCVIYNKEKRAWLRADSNGTVTFDGTEETRSVFEEIDWGFGAVSYRDTSSKKYLNVSKEIMGLSCTSDAVWGWFTMELFFRNELSGNFMPCAHTYMNHMDDEEKKTIDSLMSQLNVQVITNAMAPIANAAKMSDTVIITLGNHPLINGRECFDRPSINFPKRWKRLIDKVSEANENIILVLIAGYPYAFPNEEKSVRAVLYTSHGEQEVGNAVADVLFGRYNPAGRLSQTWYKSEKDLPPMDNYDIINHPRTYMYFNKPVQYPFGHGLSYTKFEYKNIEAEPVKDGYHITCEVTNTGKAAGDEVVQLYAKLEDTPVKAPLKKLCGFERVYFEKGETKTVTFDVPAIETRLYDEKKAKFSIIPGAVTFLIGASSADIRLELRM